MPDLTRSEALHALREASQRTEPLSPGEAARLAQQQESFDPDPEPESEPELEVEQPDDQDAVIEAFNRILDAFIEVQELTPAVMYGFGMHAAIELLHTEVGADMLPRIGAAAKLHGCEVSVDESPFRDGAYVRVTATQAG